MEKRRLNFNTSNVTIQQNLILMSNIRQTDFNTSNVTIQPATTT